MLVTNRSVLHLVALDFALKQGGHAAVTFFGHVEVWKRYARKGRPPLYIVTTLKEGEADPDKLAKAIFLAGEEHDDFS